MTIEIHERYLESLISGGEEGGHEPGAGGGG